MNYNWQFVRILEKLNLLYKYTEITINHGERLHSLGSLTMTRQTDFKSLSGTIKLGRISAKNTPREGNPDLICDLLRLLETQPEASHKELGIGVTAFDHVLHLGKLFGFIDDKKRITKSGRGMLSLGKTGQYTRMALRLDEFEVVRSWREYHEVDTFCELNLHFLKLYNLLLFQIQHSPLHFVLFLPLKN